MKSFFKKRISNNGGFTLVELLVTIVIFVILTGIVLFNQNSFNNGILLKNLAYDIALNIKQVQNYGIAVKEFQGIATSTFSSYGIYFDLANNKNFILFADVNSDSQFSGVTNCPVGDPECIQRYSISRGSFISNICTDLDPLCPINKRASTLTVLFKRPNPNALIYFDNSITPSPNARIIISSANNATTSVIVTNAGQIYVGN
jgi:prepilin-type N-terminal cleavage/methylation domain-containing protein